MKAVILAGGKGTRLQSATNGPKALAKVNGIPLLYRQLEELARNGFRDILVLTGYGAGEIEAAIASYRIPATVVSTLRESEPLGTAGALRNASDLLPDDFLVVLGDLLFRADLQAMWKQHLDTQAAATVLVHPNDHPLQSDLVDADRYGRIQLVFPKGRYEDLPCRNRAIAGIIALNKRMLSHIKPGYSDLNSEVLPSIATENCRIYESSEYVRDINTPERLDSVSEDLRKGRVRRCHRKAVFLDRDGVINVKNNFVNTPEQFILSKGVPEAIKKLRDDGYLVVCVTNQGGIELGFQTHEMLDDVHVAMDNLLAKAGTYLDRTYYCPHYEASCVCRKPQPGMLLEAAKHMRIDLKKSWMVGDSESDVEAGIAAGTRTVLIGTWQESMQTRPTCFFPDLFTATDWILRGAPQ